MKKSYALLIAAISVLSSCGTAAQYASSGNGQRFQDGIYASSPGFMTKAEKEDLQTVRDELVTKTKESEIYLFGDRKDTIMIPQNMSAVIRYDKESGGTSVTVAENPYDWRNNIDPWSMYNSAWDSWSIGWRHYGPWTYSGYWGHYDPWYGGWYSPWHGYGWYDPWYSYGWHGPWHGGWWGWHDPYWHHHYCGWYGGWGPHFPGGTVVIKDDRWHGQRGRTGSDKVFTSRVSTRGGYGTSSRTGRGSSVQGSRTNSGVAAAPSRVSSASSRNISRVATTGQTSRPAVSGSSAAVRGSISRTGTASPQVRPGQSSGPAANYRRPTVQQGSGSSVSAGVRSSYSRSATVSGSGSSSSGYSRSSSPTGYQSQDRSSQPSSSYNRSSSYNTGRSGYSGGSSSGSRGGSSGGYSRSSGSSGGRR